MSEQIGNVRLEDVLAELYIAKHGHAPNAIVAVGGTAMAAHRMRGASFDVDLYLSEVDDDIVAELSEAGRNRFGTGFKLDVTPVNTIWGHMAVKDIEQSPRFHTFQVGDRTVVLRAVTLETLYLLKAAASREKDLEDLSGIAPRLTLESVVQRANQTLGWFGDRSRLPEYLETLSRMLARDFAKPLDEVEATLAMPEAVRAKIVDMRRIRDARLVILLEPAIRRAADTIRPHPSRSAQLVFDVVASGASEQLREIAASRPDLVTAISARVLKETAPDRFKKWADECALPDAAHLSTRGDTGQHGGGASEAGKP